MKHNIDEISYLIIKQLEGDITEPEKQLLESWKKESEENQRLYDEFVFSHQAMHTLHQMEQFNSFDALQKVNSRIKQSASQLWWQVLQRVAAILLLPLLLYTTYISMKYVQSTSTTEQMAMHTVKAGIGTVSELYLPDGTKVWLNAGSSLSFPVSFTGQTRNVKLNGEAYFEVARNEEMPFILTSGKLHVQVLGTAFNVNNYNDVTEVVLTHGKVKLSSNIHSHSTDLGTLTPGYRAVYKNNDSKALIEKTDVEKYTAWIKGQMIFRDDAMSEIIRRLSRWYNVEFVIADAEINEYVYTATFTNESLAQVLYLLKISAPIDFKLEERKVLPNGEFSKQRVILMKKHSTK